MKSTGLLAIFLLGVFASVANAQVPQILSYQGRVLSEGINFTGAGQFKFALVNTDGSVSYWSNDGQVPPVQTVQLPVTNGLYSVLLGDATVTNMAAIPATVFTNSDVRLRIWFNDGTHPTGLFAPDERIGAVGYAMVAQTLASTSSANTFAGGGAGNSGPPAVTGSNCVAVGYNSLGSLSAGSGNAAVGSQALSGNQTGGGNTAIGFQSLMSNNADHNTAVGEVALKGNTTATENTAVGYGALELNTSGGSNTAVGSRSLISATGLNNVAVGQQAGYSLTSGNGNLFLGAQSGISIQSGSNNIDIANNGGSNDSGVIRIGLGRNATYIAGISGVTISPSGSAVYINSNGQLGTINSSRRFKQNIKPMGDSSEALLLLHPVTFEYNHELDPGGAPQFGLIAEEVDKIDPDLVLRDAQGQVQTVRYEAVNAMLLNEFLKEHRRVDDQRATIQEQRERIEAQQKKIQEMEAHMREVDSVLRRVNERLDHESAPPTIGSKSR